MTGPVSSVVSKESSILTGKCSEYKCVHEWIDRLKMQRIKIKCAVEVSEAFDINIDEPLHEWQEKLKEALCEADEMLSNFKARVLCEKPNPTIEGGSSTHDQLTEEEGSDDVTLLHPASNLREAITRQVDQGANLPHVQAMPEEGSDDATSVHLASHPREAVTRQVDLEANLLHDPSMQEEGSDHATLVHPASNLWEAVTIQLDLLRRFLFGIPIGRNWEQYEFHRKHKLGRYFNLPTFFPLLAELAFFPIALVLNPRNKLFGVYMENDERVSKLIKTVEKLEKIAGDIGNFIELLKLQSKRKMCRKRKRSARGLNDPKASFWLSLSNTNLFFIFLQERSSSPCYQVVSRNVRAIYYLNTSDIFNGFIMRRS